MKKGIVSVLSMVVGAATGAGVAGKIAGNHFQKMEEMSEKHLALFLMMNQWVKVKQEGKNLSSYFEQKGYKRIAIYGMSYAGETLLDELKNSSVQVVYGIDKRGDTLYTDIDIITLEDDALDEVDAVVVTAITFFDEIAEKLKEKVDCPVISLEDILYEV